MRFFKIFVKIFVKINFANSKSEAKRMIQGNGIKTNSNLGTDINKIIKIEKSLIV